MSVKGAADASLTNHAEYRRRHRSRQLRIRAVHAYANLVRQRRESQPGNPPSLGNCEKVPTSNFQRAQNHPDAYTYVDQSSPERTVLLEAKSRSRERQEVALALIDADETSHARRFINCMRKSAQLECPTMAGGCGSDDNYTPITCDSRLCPECGQRRAGQVASQYGPIIASWDYPTMIGVGLPKRIEPDHDSVEQAVEALRGAFGRLRRRVVPPDGPGWSWQSESCGEHSSLRRVCDKCVVGWKRALISVGATDIARRWQKRYIDQGRGIPFDEVLDRGFYAVDVKQQDDGRLNIHLHIIGNSPWIPQAALSHLWDDLLAAPVVDVRRVDGRGEKDAEAAALEVAGYAAKAPQYDTAEAQVEYLKAMKGSKLVQPFGQLHGNTPDVCGRLRCSNCDRTPGYWNYIDVVDGAYDTMQADWTEDGDKPPPNDEMADN